MNTKQIVWMLLLLANRSAFGQAPAVMPRSITPALAAAPTITILAAPTGAMLESQGANNASMNLGPISYFKGTSAAGETSQKKPESFVVSTRFELKVDCPGSLSSRVNLTASRLDASASYAIAIDGIALGPGAQTLVPSMPCGSRGDHRLDVEVPVSTPAGAIGSTVAFTATLRP
jgi:hypothetical protein